MVQLHVTCDICFCLFDTQNGPVYVESIAISARDNLILHFGQCIQVHTPFRFAVSPEVFILLKLN